MILVIRTYAAVAVKISVRLALVKRPILAAKKAVKAATRPRRARSEVTSYKETIAPIRRIADIKMLKMDTTYATLSAKK